ncbi:polymeric immunoglobulin receptor-like [Tachysurus ichikawai]
MCWLFVFILFISYVGSQPSMKLSLQTESTVTIPCGYDRAYIHHRKYWCSNSYSSFSSCSIQAYANNTGGKVTVTDNPAESFFTVTLDHLQTKDTGWYWCGLEIDRGADINEALYIAVKSDPDLSVNESRVRGVEGGSVTVQCLYSAEYQNTQKQWCRFKERKCNTVRTETPQNSSVYISDDGRRSFSVRMSGLKKSDAGWYETLPLWLMVALGLGLLLILVIAVTYVMRKTCKVESMRTLKYVAVKRGGSVTIPCLYEEQNKANNKFWCKGKYWSTCKIVAYANSSENPSVIDHPEQNLLTVELNSVSESGWRWCAAEVGDKWQPDDRDYLYLTVSQDPDLSVRESRVRGEEGGSVTVQCLYSAAYQNTQKQWCRFKDEQCNTVRTETSQNSSVYISDDGRGIFSVRMSRLKKSDAGWYWCSAGDLQVPVQVSVGVDAPGKYWSACSIVAYANSSGNPSVIDHPEQNLFTVELNSVSESGWRWCAAEIGDKWQPDDRDYLYLTVSQDPDLSVRETRVRGEEGGSVTVQCLYSAAYQNKQKQWCRFKDEQCNMVRTETSQTSSVYISDDGREIFSVRMSRLKKSDLFVTSVPSRDETT